MWEMLTCPHCWQAVGVAFLCSLPLVGPALFWVRSRLRRWRCPCQNCESE